MTPPPPTDINGQPDNIVKANLNSHLLGENLNTSQYRVTALSWCAEFQANDFLTPSYAKNSILCTMNGKYYLVYQYKLFYSGFDFVRYLILQHYVNYWSLILPVFDLATLIK